MREKKPFVIEFVIGVILAGAGTLAMAAEWFVYYSRMLFACGFGLIFSSAVQIIRITYWQNPKRQDEYAEKKREARIDRLDERKQYIRMKAGHMTYQIMTFSMLILAFVLALLHVEAWVIAIFMGLFILQWIMGIIVYRTLEKKM